MAHSYTKKEGLGMMLLRSLILEFPHMVYFAFIHITLVACKSWGGKLSNETLSTMYEPFGGLWEVDNSVPVTSWLLP